MSPSGAGALDDLTIDTAALSRGLGATIEWSKRARFEELKVLDTVVEHATPVDIAVQLESVPDGIALTGSVIVPWHGPCRRCMSDVSGELALDLDEQFASAHEEGETYPIGHDEVDLAPAIRDAILLALPTGPLCDDDCAGPDPESFPLGAAADGEAPASDSESDGGGETEDRQRPIDPRWAALDVLRDDSTGEA